VSRHQGRRPPPPSGDGKAVVAYLHPGEVATGFHTSLIDLLIHDMMTDRRIVSGGGHFAMRSGANIVNGRNDLARTFLDAHTAEWLLMVDADMTFGPDVLERLIEAADPTERPVVGALCFGVWEAGQHTEIFPTLYWFTEDPKGVARAQEFPDNQLVQVGATGAACILIHRSVLQTMRNQFPEPWPWFAEQVYDGRPMSEDITFCLRAGSLGVPIWVHTGIKTGHVKQRVINHQAFNEYTAMLTEPDFVITGTGRSGTGYISRLLTAVGIRCGHEEWWNPYNKRTPGLAGDASWLAVPHLDGYQGRVFHQIRDPLKVISSLMNGEMSEDYAEPYRTYKQQHCPTGYTPDDLTSTVQFVARWLQQIDLHTEDAWRLEDIDEAFLVDLAATLGRPIDPIAAKQAITAVPTTYNKHRTGHQYTWDELPDIPETAWLAEWAARWGYTTITQGAALG
jgi:hypothetical protein